MARRLRIHGDPIKKSAVDDLFSGGAVMRFNADQMTTIDGAEVNAGLAAYRFSSSERMAIDRDNALRMMPRLKG